MNFESLLLFLEDTRALLERSQITPTALLVTGLIAAVFFLLSLREVVSWFLKVSLVRVEVRRLRKQSDEMLIMMTEIREALITRDSSVQPPAAVERFPLDH